MGTRALCVGTTTASGPISPFGPVPGDIWVPGAAGTNATTGTYRRVYPVTSLLRTSIIFFFSNVISYIHIIKKKEKEGNTDNSA